MFLFERIFGNAIYSIILVFFTVNISKSKSMKSVKRYMIWFVIALSIMGYFYLPYSTADLYRTKYLITSIYKNMDFNQIISFVRNNGFRLHHLYYWLFGKMNNLNLLPAITAMLFYSNCFCIIYKSAKKYQYSQKTISLMILFLMVGRTIC